MSRGYVLQPFRTAVDLQIDYAAELNPQQLAAVTALPGPALVIAGAGAGKTRTLTYRVAYLLEQGIPPDLARLLARQTVAGSGALLAASPEAASALRVAVTSPGGTTAEALKVLMDPAAWPAAMSKAIAAATNRSRELAG